MSYEDDTDEVSYKSWKYVHQCDKCKTVFGSDYEYKYPQAKKICPNCDGSFKFRNGRWVRDNRGGNVTTN
jgi:rRNA maturation endonuclease Nob1